MHVHPIALNAVYLVVAAATAPWWARKARGGWGERFGRIEPLPATRRPRLLIHAVSVGEVNLVRPLVERLSGEVDLVVSATTDTGIARARDLFTGRCHVVRYPLDATWSVRRFLDAVQPDAVALAELELWPNFGRACEARGIPLAVVNGRLSARSFRRYRRARRFVGGLFGRLAFAAVQDEHYGARFQEMGVQAGRCHVVGSMKWDAASAGGDASAADRIAADMGIDRDRLLVVAGSTAPDEHALIRDAVRAAAGRAGEDVQLLCAPRRPEWFDDAAQALAGCVRRSEPGVGTPDAGLFLLDTIGELGAAYQIADIVIVGRSFGGLHGSDPMQPAAMGKPTLVGPAVGDFEMAVGALRDDWGIIQTTRDGLAGVLERLIADPAARRAVGDAGAACVARHRGATERHAQLLLELVGDAPLVRSRRAG